jgi:hypothetical protein
MIIDLAIAAVSLTVFVTSAVSLGYVTKCKPTGLDVLTKSNYAVMLASGAVGCFAGYMAYQKHTGKAVNDYSEYLPQITGVGGIILLQLGVTQYAVMTQVSCDEESKKNISNCYSLFMALGMGLTILGYLLGTGKLKQFQS